MTEERDKLVEVTKELSELTQKVSESVELERKVQDLEQKLQLAYSKSDDQASIDTHMATEYLRLPLACC